MSASDTKLLEQARAGNREALEALLERYQGRVYRFGMKMCRDPEDAKDVLQDTLFALARSVRDFRGASSISTWLYTIARNFCLKKRRGASPAPERTFDAAEAREAAALGAPAEGPDELLEGKQLEQALERAIGALDPMYREVLVLRDVEGLSGAEVAAVLGLGVTAVKSRLHRARLEVRSRLAPLLGVAPAISGVSAGCPDVLMSFTQHLENEIDAQVCAAMQRHIDSCERCRGACESLRRTLSLCSASSASIAVPEDVQSSVRRALRDLLTQQR